LLSLSFSYVLTKCPVKGSIFTLNNSTRGNYLFVLYRYEGNETYIDKDGNKSTVKIDELRFGILKFELSDTQYLLYETDEKGNNISKIKIEQGKGLPKPKEAVKKAVFVNYFPDLKTNYELQVIDRESKGVAKFFSEKIIDCDYLARPKHYLSLLNNHTRAFINNLKTENTINENQLKEATDRFISLIHTNNKINQLNMANLLFGGLLDEEIIEEEITPRLVDLYHDNGLVINEYILNQSEVELFYKKQTIHFGNEGVLKFDKQDIDSGTVILGEERNEYFKYEIKIYTDRPPKSLITDK